MASAFYAIIEARYGPKARRQAEADARHARAYLDAVAPFFKNNPAYPCQEVPMLTNPRDPSEDDDEDDFDPDEDDLDEDEDEDEDLDEDDEDEDDEESPDEDW